MIGISTTAHSRKLIERTAEINGEDLQLDQLIEECAELIVAVSHYRRVRISSHDLRREMADVLCMLSAVEVHMGSIAGGLAMVETLEKIEKWVEASE